MSTNNEQPAVLDIQNEQLYQKHKKLFYQDLDKHLTLENNENIEPNQKIKLQRNVRFKKKTKNNRSCDKADIKSEFQF